MAIVADLQAKLGADVSSFASAMGEAGEYLAQLMEHSNQAQEGLSGIGEAGEEADSKIGGFGSTLASTAALTLGVATAIGGGVVAVGLLGEKYNDAMLVVQNAGQLTDAQSQQVQNSLIGISNQGGATFQQMTSAIAPYMGVIKQLPGSLGNVGQATTQVATASKDLSETMGVSLSSAFQVTTGMLQAYHLPASQATAVTNQLASVSSATGVPITTLGSTIDQLKSRLGATAPSFTMTGALMEDLAQHGITGSRGIRYVSTGLQSLYAPSTSAEKELKSLGITTTNAAGQFLPLPTILDNIRAKTQGMTQSQQEAALALIFGKSAAGAFDAILQDQPGHLQAIATALGKSTAAQQGAQRASETLDYQMEHIKNTFENTAAVIGEKVAPYLVELVSDAGDLASKAASLAGQLASDLSPAFSLVKSAASDVANALSGPLHTGLSLIESGFHDAGSVVRDAASVVKSAFDDIKTGVEEAVTSTTGMSTFDKIFTDVGTTIRTVVGDIKAGLATASSLFHDFSMGLSGMVTSTTGMSTLGRIFTEFGQTVRSIEPQVEALAKTIGSDLETGAKVVGSLITGTLLPAMQQLGSYLSGTVEPKAKELADTLGQTLGPAIEKVGNFIKSNLGPALAALGAGAMAGPIAGFLGLGAAAEEAATDMEEAAAASAAADPPFALIAIAAFGVFTAIQHWSQIKSFVEEYLKTPINDVKSVFSGLSSTVTGTLATIGSAFAGAAGFVNEFKTPIIVVASTITGLLMPALAGLAASMVTNLAAAAAAAATDIGETIALYALEAAGAVTDAATSVAAFATMIVEWAVAAAAATADAVAMAAAWVIALGPIGLIAAGVAALVALIVLNWGTVKSTTEAVWNAVAGFLTSIWQTIASTADTVWDAIRDHLGLVIDAIVLLFTGPLGLLVALVVQHWSQIETETESIWNAVVGFLTGIWNTIQSTASSVWSAIQSTLSAVWQAISSTASSIWNGISSLLTGIWNTLSSTASSIWNGIESALSAIWNAIQSAASSVWNAISTTITTVWNTIKSTAQSVWSAIQSLITGAWSTIQSTASSAWSAISSLISSAWDTIRSVVQGAIAFVQSTAQAGFNAIRATVASVFATIQSDISSAWSTIKSLFQSGVDTIKQVWSDAWHSLTQAVSEAQSAVTSTISGMISTIKGMFGDALSWLYDAGKDVVDGLANGIKAAVGDAISAANSVGNAVKGAIKSFGLSPWPSMIESGHDVVDGLVVGMTDSIPDLVASAATVSDGLLGGFNAALEISSPSRKAQKVGTNVTQGLANGISAGTATAATAAANAGKAVADALTSTLSLVQSAGVFQAGGGSVAGVGGILASLNTVTEQLTDAFANFAMKLKTSVMTQVQSAAQAVTGVVQAFEGVLAFLQQLQTFVDAKTLIMIPDHLQTVFGTVIDLLLAVFTYIVDHFNGALLAAIQTAAQAVSAIFAPFGDVMTFLQNLTTFTDGQNLIMIPNHLQTVFGTVIDLLLSVFQYITNHFSSEVLTNIQAAANAVDAVFKPFGDVMTFLENLTTFVDSQNLIMIPDHLQTVFGTVMDLLLQVFVYITKHFSSDILTSITAAANAVDAVLKPFTDVLTYLEDLTTFVDGKNLIMIPNHLQTVFGTVMVLLLQVFEYIVKHFSTDILSAIQQAATAVDAVFKPFEDVLTYLTDLSTFVDANTPTQMPAHIQTVLGTVMTQLTQAFLVVANGFKSSVYSAISTAANAIDSVFKPFEDALTFLTDLTTYLDGSNVQSVPANLLTAMSTVLLQLVAAFRQIEAQVNSTVLTSISSAATAIDTVFKPFEDALTFLQNEISLEQAQAGTTIDDDLVPFLASVAGDIVYAFENLSQQINGPALAAADKTASGVDSIVTVMGNLITMFGNLEKMSEVSQAQWQAFVANFSAAMGVIPQLLDSAQPALAAAQSFLSVAQQIAQALQQGMDTLKPFGISVQIQNVAANTSDAAQAAAQTAQSVTDQVNSQLGVASPSTVMATTGQQVDAGLAQGITAGAGAVQTAAGSLATQLVSAFTQGTNGIATPPIVAGSPNGGTPSPTGSGTASPWFQRLEQLFQRLEQADAQPGGQGPVAVHFHGPITVHAQDEAAAKEAFAAAANGLRAALTAKGLVTR